MSIELVSTILVACGFIIAIYFKKDIEFKIEKRDKEKYREENTQLKIVKEIDDRIRGLEGKLIDKMDNTEISRQISQGRFEIFLSNLFTKKELELYKYLDEGLTTKEIAAKCSNTTGAINNKISQMLQKLNISDRNKIEKKVKKLYEAQTE